MKLPALVLHADWGRDPAKRWMAAAELVAGGGRTRYRATPPAAVPVVPPPGHWFRDLLRGTGGAPVLLGFDFPIGLPARYAERAGIARFLDLLSRLGRDPWAHFFDVAERPEDISLHRPFYPQRPGGTSRRFLVERLGVEEHALWRVCERAHPGRVAASPLFWTLGAQQVGKAAIAGWRELLVPAVRDIDGPPVALWPFSGPLAACLGHHPLVVAETYPAECYRHLGVSFAGAPAGTRWGKRVQAARAAHATGLIAWAQTAGVTLDAALDAALRDGFGADVHGEDRFDAVVGLFGMLNVVLGGRAASDPDDPALRDVEGWILGQAPPAPPPPHDAHASSRGA